MEKVANSFAELLKNAIGAAITITLAALIVRFLIYLWTHFIL